jgi:hypothetical protein
MTPFWNQMGVRWRLLGPFWNQMGVRGGHPDTVEG